jgi:uncharacterized protein (TIGR02145 family)
MNIPCPGTPTVTYGGKIYNTVQIGNQCWLKENLDVGTMIQGIDTAKNNGTIEKYCYNNDTNTCNTYGGLYQWDEAMQYTTTSGTRGICPTGWHLPTTAEFQILSTSVNNDGNALKAGGQGQGAGVGTNTSGFSALLAGDRYNGGDYLGLDVDANFWSSNKYGQGIWWQAWSTYLLYNNNTINTTLSWLVTGCSIRCIKD